MNNTFTPRQVHSYSPVSHTGHGMDASPQYTSMLTGHSFLTLSLCSSSRTEISSARRRTVRLADRLISRRCCCSRAPKKATSMNNLSADMVSRIEYDEKEQECLAKDEQIQVNEDLLIPSLSLDCSCLRFSKRRFVDWNIYFIWKIFASTISLRNSNARERVLFPRSSSRRRRWIVVNRTRLRFSTVAFLGCFFFFFFDGAVNHWICISRLTMFRKERRRRFR